MMKSKENPGGLFIPGGLLTGMGIGFLTDNVPAGLFIGLGLGFVCYALSMFVKPGKQ
jgi:hypothetical protein